MNDTGEYPILPLDGKGFNGGGEVDDRRMAGRNPNQSIWVLPVPFACVECPMYSAWFRLSPPGASDIKSCDP